jgi:acetyl esterase/lipase
MKMAEDQDRVTVTSDVVFGRGGGRDLRCDIYRPAGAVEHAPAVLMVHGGGWRGGDRKQLATYGYRVAREGYVCVLNEYRLTPESPWPAHIHDVKAALRWVRANSAELSIDPDRIAIHGNSAGAHLAMLAAGTPDLPAFEGDGGNPGVSTKVCAAVGIYTPTVFRHEERLRGSVPLTAMVEGGDAEIAAAASPLSYVSGEFPPALLIHGTKDTVVPPVASLLMYEALIKAGAPAELHMYADQPHGFDFQPQFGRLCAAEVSLFLDRYVKGTVPTFTMPTAAAVASS